MGAPWIFGLDIFFKKHLHTGNYHLLYLIIFVPKLINNNNFSLDTCLAMDSCCYFYFT